MNKYTRRPIYNLNVDIISICFVYEYAIYYTQDYVKILIHKIQFIAIYMNEILLYCTRF